MFHFRSRSAFLAQAAEALRPGGRLALSDILLTNPGDRAPVDIAVLTDKGRAEFARLARDERSLSWQSRRAGDYAVSEAGAAPVLEARS